MMKFVIPMLIALSPLVSNAKVDVLLDCRNPQDGFEVNLCEGLQEPSCEDVAKKGVQIVNQNHSGRTVNIVNVKTIQEDASYEVGFSYADDQYERMITNKVFVSTGLNSCSLNSIQR